MPAGTIALTINSKTVTGSGTAFTTELKVNDFVVAVVGGVTYTLGVAAIASNTSLTLNTAFGGPTTSGLAWSAVPNQVLVGITAQVASDTARAIRGLNYDKDNWQKIYSDVASVTIQRPDGSMFTGPSWGYMSAQYANKADKTALDSKADKTDLDAYARNGSNADITSLTGLTTALSVAQGGTGGTNPSTARGGLGLGSASTSNVQASASDNTPGVLLTAGAFGLGGNSPPGAANASSLSTTGFYAAGGASATNFFDNYSPLIMVHRTPTAGAQIQPTTSGRLAVRGTGGSIWTAWNEMWSTGNTTVDTNNFIKKASPIARLTNDVLEMQDDFAVDEQHIISGLVSVNAEAEGVIAEKAGRGIYLVKGAVGMADEGWTLEVPQDINGNRLCFVELATDKEGVITVSVFKRRFDVDSAMIVAGEPMDIPEGRWIDLRLQMPEDSAWNTRMREMEQAAGSRE